MKKHSLILILLLMSSGILFAQVEKGNLFLAGYSNLGLDIGKNKNKSGGVTADNYSYSEFFINPEAGYFILDNLMVGGFLDFYYDSDKYASDRQDKYSKIIIGPNVRYYILKFGKLMPYGEVRLGVGTENSKYRYSSSDSYNSTKSTYVTARVGAGGTYFFTDNLGLDAFAGYDYDAWTTKNDDAVDSPTSTKNTNFYSSLEMNLGLVFTIGK
jgi:hypothetical protein